MLARGSFRSLMYFDLVTDAGPASHRVRLWQGGPASTSCHFRPRCAVVRSCTLVVVWVHIFFKFGYWEVEGRWQWRLIRPLALPSFVARSAPLRRTPDTFPFWSLYSDGPLSSRPQPLGRVGDVAPCEDTREDLGLSL